jgi:hypothetical protein
MVSITQERLRALLSYDSESGLFTWRNAAGQGGRIPPGSVAGSIGSQGYRVITIGSQRLSAARLAWLYVYGVWPPNQIDHINRERSDDRISNLRLATSGQNKANNGMYRNNTSGFKGVYFDKERGHWRAKTKVNGKRMWLGRFATREEAYAAYCNAVKNEYGEFACTGDDEDK